MAGSGKKKSAEQKQAEQNQAGSPASNLGTAGNPIQGPPLVDFSRGPEVNYTLPQHRVDSGESQIGTQANPLVGPAIGSSPGVQNPGDMTISGPAAPLPHLDETSESGDKVSMHNMRMRAAHSTASAAGEGTPATFMTTDEDGKPRQVSVVPRPGETAEDAVRRIAKDGGDTEPLKEESDLTNLKMKQAADTNKLIEKHQEDRTKLGAKHQKALEKHQEDGAALAEKHRAALDKNPGDNDVITKNSTERQAFDGKEAEEAAKRQEEFQKLQDEQQKEVIELEEQQAKDLVESQNKVTEAQQKERDSASNDGPTHRRGTTTHSSKNKTGK